MAEYDGTHFRIDDPPDGSTRISTYELTQFLYYFRAAYAFFTPIHASSSPPDVGNIDSWRVAILPDDVRKATKSVISFRNVERHWDKLLLDHYAEMELPTDLEISEISYHSPLQMVLAGVPVALAAALILSGGELNLIGVVKVKLPPLATGIAKLRAAFRQPAPSRHPKKSREEDAG